MNILQIDILLIIHVMQLQTSEILICVEINIYTTSGHNLVTWSRSFMESMRDVFLRSPLAQ